MTLGILPGIEKGGDPHALVGVHQDAHRAGTEAKPSCSNQPVQRQTGSQGGQPQQQAGQGGGAEVGLLEDQQDQACEDGQPKHPLL